MTNEHPLRQTVFEGDQAQLVPFPINSDTKVPAVRFTKSDSFNVDKTEIVGYRLDNYLVFDLDNSPDRLPKGIAIKDAGLVILEWLERQGVDRKKLAIVKTRSGGYHVYLKVPDAYLGNKLNVKTIPLNCVDLKYGSGMYVVAPGSVHQGSEYTLQPSTDVLDTATASEMLMQTLLRRNATTVDDESEPGLVEPEQLEAILKALDPTDFAENDKWIELAMACHFVCPCGGGEFLDWSAKDSLYTDHEERNKLRWESFGDYSGKKLATGTLYKVLLDSQIEGEASRELATALAILAFAGVEDESEDSERNISEQQPRRKILSLDDLLGLESPEWILDGALPVGSLGVLYGPPKSAKTFLALDLAMCISAQREQMLGLACRSGKVLYVLAEGGAPMMNGRVKAWLEHHDAEAASIGVYPHAVSLSSKVAVTEFIQMAGDEWDLVIFDTLARCMDGDENSAKDMSNAIKGCDLVREETGAAVLLVHHAGKDASKGLRGSTALLGAVDAVWRMRPTSPNGHFEFRVEELRHGEPAESCLLRLVTNGRSAVLVDAHDAQSDFDPKMAIRDLAAALDDGISRRVFHDLVATEISCSVSTARRLTAEAVPLGKTNGITTINAITVWREGDPSSGSPKAEIIRNDKDH